MAFLFTNSILGIPLRGKQARCYVIAIKQIASLPASRQADPPTLGQSASVVAFASLSREKLRPTVKAQLRYKTVSRSFLTFLIGAVQGLINSSRLKA